MLDILAELDLYWEQHGVEAMSELLIREQLDQIAQESDLLFRWRSAKIPEMTQVLRDILRGGLDEENLKKHRIGHPASVINDMRAEIPAIQKSVLRCLHTWTSGDRVIARRVAENRLLFMAALALLALWDLRQWFAHGERAGLHCRIRQSKLQVEFKRRDVRKEQHHQRRLAKRILNVEAVTGWGEAVTSRKAHFFNQSTVALCGHLMLWHGKVYSEDDATRLRKCLPCVKKLAELNTLSAGREAQLHWRMPLQQRQQAQAQAPETQVPPPPVGKSNDCPPPPDNVVLPPDSAAAIIPSEKE